jgi:hypothetical protein
MLAAVISALALVSSPQPVRAQAIATVNVQIISGARLQLRRAPQASSITGAKVNTQKALIEFY